MLIELHLVSTQLLFRLKNAITLLLYLLLLVGQLIVVEPHLFPANSTLLLYLLKLFILLLELTLTDLDIISLGSDCF